MRRIKHVLEPPWDCADNRIWHPPLSQDLNLERYLTFHHPFWRRPKRVLNDRDDPDLAHWFRSDGRINIDDDE